MRRTQDRVRDEFGFTNIVLEHGQIRVWYGTTAPMGGLWIPYPGGPIRGERAISEARWIVDHIHEHRALLPADVRGWPIVLCVCNGSDHLQPVGFFRCAS